MDAELYLFVRVLVTIVAVRTGIEDVDEDVDEDGSTKDSENQCVYKHSE